MSDLLENFFNEDLTDAEEEALEKSFLESPETASRFSILADQAYAATGLPAHQWPGKNIMIPHIGGIGTRLKLFLTFLTGGNGNHIDRLRKSHTR